MSPDEQGPRPGSNAYREWGRPRIPGWVVVALVVVVVGLIIAAVVAQI